MSTQWVESTDAEYRTCGANGMPASRSVCESKAREDGKTFAHWGCAYSNGTSTVYPEGCWQLDNKLYIYTSCPGGHGYSHGYKRLCATESNRQNEDPPSQKNASGSTYSEPANMFDDSSNMTFGKCIAGSASNSSGERMVCKQMQCVTMGAPSNIEDQPYVSEQDANDFQSQFNVVPASCAAVLSQDQMERLQTAVSNNTVRKVNDNTYEFIHGIVRIVN